MKNDGTISRVALVTGATGFIGSRLAAALAARGWEVHAVVRAGAELKELAGHEGKVTVHEFDGETESLMALVQGIKPDVGFHLASLFLAQHKPGDIVPMMQSNVTFGTQLLEAFAAAGVVNLVNTGTAWQHFGEGEYCPVNLYAASKQAFEAVTRFYAETAGLRVIHLKLFDTYGAGDPRAKFISLLLKAARTGEVLAMSPGEQLIDIVHVNDVVRAFEMAAERLLSGAVQGEERYGISSGKPVTLKALVGILGDVLGKPLPVKFGARGYRAREVMVPWRNGAALPGWRAEVELGAGLRDLCGHAQGVKGVF